MFGAFFRVFSCLLQSGNSLTETRFPFFWPFFLSSLGVPLSIIIVEAWERRQPPSPE